MAWYARKEPGRYQIAWREPDRRIRYKTFKRSEDARAFKADIEAKLLRGDYTPQDSRKMPLGEYIDIVLGAGDLADSTLGAYAYRRKHTAALERKPIGEVTSADIRKLMAVMEAQNIGAPARTSVRKLLSKVFAAAVKDGVLVRNPVASVPAPRSDRREIHVYAPREIEALAEAIGPELRPAVLLSAYGGLRGGEVAGLRVMDVDWLRSSVTIRQAVRLVRGRAVIGEPKTKASRRTVAVPRFVVEALNVEGAVATRGLTEPKEQGTPAPSTLLFPGHSSKTLGAAFRQALVATGLEGRWHDLRHTSVALAIQAGAHPKQIQVRLGHENITTTLDTYGHLFPGMDEELAERMQQYGEAPNTLGSELLTLRQETP